MTLSLYPFFEFYRSGNPYHLAAVQELQDAMPADLLSDDAEWFQTWKQSGLAVRTYGVPYYSQYFDDDSGFGYRRCFTYAAAMVAAFHGKVETAADYNKLRIRYGSSVSVDAQLLTLRALGLKAEFRQDADEAAIEAELMSGRPVLVGWLHKGNLLRGEPPECDSYACGHWSVITGMNGGLDSEWIMHDPAGTPAPEHGGHVTKIGGKGTIYPRATFRQRWMVDGPGTGWMVTVREP